MPTRIDETTPPLGTGGIRKPPIGFEPTMESRLHSASSKGSEPLAHVLRPPHHKTRRRSWRNLGFLTSIPPRPMVAAPGSRARNRTAIARPLQPDDEPTGSREGKMFRGGDGALWGEHHLLPGNGGGERNGLSQIAGSRHPVHVPPDSMCYITMALIVSTHSFGLPRTNASTTLKTWSDQPPTFRIDPRSSGA